MLTPKGVVILSRVSNIFLAVPLVETDPEKVLLRVLAFIFCLTGNGDDCKYKMLSNSDRSLVTNYGKHKLKYNIYVLLKIPQYR